MAKREKKIIISGVTREAMEDAFGRYATADAEAQSITAEMDRQFVAIREQYATIVLHIRIVFRHLIECLCERPYLLDVSRRVHFGGLGRRSLRRRSILADQVCRVVLYSVGQSRLRIEDVYRHRIVPESSSSRVV